MSWFDGMSGSRTINLQSLKRGRSSVSGNRDDASINNDNEVKGNAGENKLKKINETIAVKEMKPKFVSSEGKYPPGKPDEFERSKHKGESLFHLSQHTSHVTAASGDTSALSALCYEENFYNVPCEQLARTLLGKILVRRLDSGCVLKGRIVETECYLGGEDQASHSFHGKMTERNAPMFMKPGTAYVYFTYGMYHCFNISSQGPGAAVLIRALEPLEGLDEMSRLRAARSKKKAAKALKAHELCNGPAKLCIAMDIDRDSCNKRDLSSWPGLSVHPDQLLDGEAQRPVVVTKRVGIESAGAEWADKPLRFYLLGCPSVSKRDRARERELV